jgi:hypothetical protein
VIIDAEGIYSGLGTHACPTNKGAHLSQFFFFFLRKPQSSFFEKYNESLKLIAASPSLPGLSLEARHIPSALHAGNPALLAHRSEWSSHNEAEKKCCATATLVKDRKGEIDLVCLFGQFQPFVVEG